VAFRRIAEKKVIFISRGDESGTHKKEKELWQEAGIAPSEPWYREAGQGMEAVLTTAGEQGGYTLSDRGTYLAAADKVSLRVLVEGDRRLFNPYSVIAVNPARHSHVNYLGSMQLIAWITSPIGQKIIGNFTIGGEPLFIPTAIPNP
jgi:tungstate transport system substrate-binding protein